MNTLPEECLVHILAFAATTPSSVHSLLLTNRTLFRLCAQILYSDPFDHIERHSKRSITWVVQQRQLKLLHLLLACSDVAQKDSGVNIPRKPTIDYLSLQSCYWEKSVFFLPGIHRTFSPGPLRHSGSTPLAQGAGDESEVSTGEVLRHFLPDSIHFNLVGHSPQHIHTIGFSVHGISILGPLIPQLSSLSCLVLCKRQNYSEVSGCTGFIRSHRRQHSSLQEIHIMKKIRDRTNLSCLVKAMGQPRVVNVNGWPDADQYLDQFPLQQCRVLLIRLSSSTATSTLSPTVIASLSKLQVLQMPAFSPEMFSALSSCQDPALSSVGPLNEAAERRVECNHGSHSRTGLRSIRLKGFDDILIPALQEACSIFRSTLRDVSSHSSFGKRSLLSLSWDWTLPCLRLLDLEGSIATTFDIQSLRHCPMLEDLRLNVGRAIPADWDVSLKARQLACVAPTLRRLQLSGWWDLPDSELTGILVPVLKRLFSLDLMWCRGPTSASVLQLMPGWTGLRWLGISATKAEYDQILNLKATLGLSIEIDVFLC